MKTPDKKSSFKQKKELLITNKEKIYALMKKQAANPETIAYYEQQAKEMGEIDLKILKDD